MAETDKKKNDDLKTAGEFVNAAIASRQITDSMSGQPVQAPVDTVEIRTGFNGSASSLHFIFKGNDAAELNQPAIASAAKDVLSKIPSLAQNFNFTDQGDGQKPVIHNWRDDRNLDIKFDGVDPVAVVKEILTMAQGASMAAPDNSAVLGKYTADVVADRQAAANQHQFKGVA